MRAGDAMSIDGDFYREIPDDLFYPHHAQGQRLPVLVRATISMGGALVHYDDTMETLVDRAAVEG